MWLIGWVSLWLRQTPLFFLVVAVMAFFVGLVCFTHPAKQGRFVFISTTIVTCTAAAILLAVVAWLALERWTFSHKEPQWQKHIDRTQNRLLVENERKWLFSKLKYSFGWPPETDSGTTAVAEPPVLPIITTEDPITSKTPLQRPKLGGLTRPVAATPIAYRSESLPARLLTGSDAFHGPGRTQPQPQFTIVTIPLTEPMEDEPEEPVLTAEPDEMEAGLSLTRRPSFRSMGQHVMRLNKFVHLLTGLAPRQRQAGSGRPPQTGEGQARRPVKRVPRLAPLVIKAAALSQLELLFQLRPESSAAPIRHITFSRDGKWLATCGDDPTAIIWRVETGGAMQLTAHKCLLHRRKTVEAVAWSSSGEYLLTKVHERVMVWTTGLAANEVQAPKPIQDWRPVTTVTQPMAVDAIVWLPDTGGDHFACISRSTISIFVRQPRLSKTIATDLALVERIPEGTWSPI